MISRNPEVMDTFAARLRHRRQPLHRLIEAGLVADESQAAMARGTPWPGHDRRVTAAE
jgi:hypothetical protein